MGILGSTGSYAYLTREQRKRIATLAKQHAGDIPMMVCVGAVSTDAILYLADDAQAAGANALLLPAVSYQPLRDEEVFSLLRLLPGTCLYRCVSMIIRALRILPLRTNYTVVSHYLRVFARSRSLVSRIAPLQQLSG